MINQPAAPQMTRAEAKLAKDIATDLSTNLGQYSADGLFRVRMFMNICFIHWDTIIDNTEQVRDYVETHWTHSGIDEFRYMDTAPASTDYILEAIRFVLRRHPVTFVTKREVGGITIKWSRGPAPAEIEADLREYGLDKQPVYMTRMESYTAFAAQ